MDGWTDERVEREMKTFKTFSFQTAFASHG